VFSQSFQKLIRTGKYFHTRIAKTSRKLMPCQRIRKRCRPPLGFNASANQRTNADKRIAMGMLLADRESAGKTDRWPAEAAGASKEFVSQLLAAPRSTGSGRGET
jgi:hypothetical protein